MSISNRSYPHMILFQSKSHLNLPFAFANCHYVVAFFHVSSGALCVFFSVKCVCVCVLNFIYPIHYSTWQDYWLLFFGLQFAMCVFFSGSHSTLSLHTLKRNVSISSWPKKFFFGALRTNLLAFHIYCRAHLFRFAKCISIL